MNKLVTLFFALFLVNLPNAMQANPLKEKQDDTKYLAGAVPEVDGKVVFSKEFQIAGMSQTQVYDTMLQWMTERLKENNNRDSRIVFTDKEKGTIAGIGEEWIIFKSKPLMLDRTLINYQITATCKENSCFVEIEKIRYTYQENLKYTAEEWITDKYALNKDKTKLIRRLAKWRRKTVDFADDIFVDVAVAFGAPDTRAEAQLKKIEKKDPTAIVAGSGPVVIGQSSKTTNKKTQDGYVEVDVKQIPGDVYTLLNNCKVVISIGEDEFNMTNMTANGGGAIGKQSDKVVAYCTLSANQSHEAMDKTQNYMLKLYAPDQTTPTVIIECRKLDTQTIAQEGHPQTYVGEIIRLLIKE